MITIKRTAVLALSLLMVLSGALARAEGRRPVELVIYSQLANSSGRQIGWAAEVLKERFNVSVTIVSDAIDGTFATRMEEGNLGDIVIFGSDGNNYMDAVKTGMLFDWEEDDLLEEYGAYILEHMSVALDKNRRISGTGTLYGFGHNVASSADNHEAFFYYPQLRWDLYTRLGYPRIDTLEDFIPVIEAMVALEPQTDTGLKTYGVSFFPDWDGDMVMMVKATGALYGYDEFNFGLYDTKTQTYEDCLKPDGMYLRALKFYNMLYQKGLLDPDSMTQTFNDMDKKYLGGVAHFNIFEWMATPFNTPEHMEAGKIMMPVAAADQKNIAYGLSVFGGNRVWTIGAKTHYPELCMEIINWFCTPEGILTYCYGPQGVTWDIDEHGNTYLTELGLQCQEDKKNTKVTYGDYTGSYQDGEFQHNNTTFTRDAVNPLSAAGETYDYRFWASTLQNKTVYPIEQTWRDYTGYSKADAYLEGNGYLSVSIGSSFTNGTRDNEFETTWTQVKQAIRSGSWKAIYAKSDSEYDFVVSQMIQNAKAYGYDQCVQWCQEQALLRKEAEDMAKR